MDCCDFHIGPLSLLILLIYDVYVFLYPLIEKSSRITAEIPPAGHEFSKLVGSRMDPWAS